MLKNIVRISAFGIFLFQMQNSICKFVKGPIVQEKSFTTTEDIKMPIIYVCEDNQFQYEAARSIGYEYMSTFTMGQIKNSSQNTWKGKNKDQTFESLQKMLYESDYHQFSLNYGKAKKLYIAPHGWCMKLDKSVKPKEYVTTTSESLLLMVDPNIDNDIRTLEMENARITFGPTTTNLFDWAVYEASIVLSDAGLNDGRTCTSYEKTNSSYGQCIENVLKQQVLLLYGCLPPWFPRNTDKVCEEDLKVHVNDRKLYEKVYDDFRSLYFGRTMDLLDECKIPCLTMNVRKSNSFKNNQFYDKS